MVELTCTGITPATKDGYSDSPNFEIGIDRKGDRGLIRRTDTPQELLEIVKMNGGRILPPPCISVRTVFSFSSALPFSRTASPRLVKRRGSRNCSNAEFQESSKCRHERKQVLCPSPRYKSERAGSEDRVPCLSSRRLAGTVPRSTLCLEEVGGTGSKRGRSVEKFGEVIETLEKKLKAEKQENERLKAEAATKTKTGGKQDGNSGNVEQEQGKPNRGSWW